MTDWQTRLCAAGYAGELTSEAILAECRRRFPANWHTSKGIGDPRNVTFRIEQTGGKWFAAYYGAEGGQAGDSKEEAAANLLLWIELKKCPRKPK